MTVSPVQSLERIENAFGARVDGDRRAIAPEDHAVAVEHEQRALGDALLLAVSTVGARHGALRLEIRKQRKVKPPILRESLMTPGPVDEDSEQFGLLFVKLGENFIVERDLVAAHRTPIRRVEAEHDRAAAQVSQRKILIWSDWQREGGGSRPGSEQFRHVEQIGRAHV